MAETTSGRLLRMLSLLQARPTWTAQELADRLDVTTRTVRRDVSRLRDLGYPVDATSGPYGGYQLGPGAVLPPLLLDDDEAVAIAVGLRAAADGSVVGLEDATLSALAKLESVLPAPLAGRVRALHTTTLALATRAPEGVDAAVLVELAQACRRSERVRFAYVDGVGQQTDRRVEPYRLVRAGLRWYLVARDVDRDGWRTFRVDRVRSPGRIGERAELVDPPDPVELVQRGLAVAPYPFQARLRLPLPPEEAADVIPPSAALLRGDGQGATVVEIGSADLEGMARWVCGLACACEVLEPLELRIAVRERAERLLSTNGDRVED